jgi:predicted ATP-grasp superfamily ATP-dependent carboligase
MPAVFVLGMGLTGLAVARSLGRRGIPVWGFDDDPKRIGFSSRFCKGMVCPAPVSEEDALAEFLLLRGRGAGGRPILFPTSDEFLLAVSSQRERLSPVYSLPLADRDVILAMNDKRRFHELTKRFGVPSPRTYFPRDLQDLERIAEEVSYPCILKPIYSFLYSGRFVKVVRATSRKDLLDQYAEIFSSRNDAIVQEVIAGPDDQQYAVGSYLNGNSEAIAVFISRKIRQRPAGFGIGTFYESCDNPVLQQRSLSFLQGVGYRGLSEIEYKRDSRDGEYKIIEVNTRPWIQVSHAYRLGIDFPYLAYRELAGEDVTPVEAERRCVKWIHFGEDLSTVLGRNGYLASGEWRRGDWLRSLRGDKTYAVFARDDMKPFLKSVFELLSRIVTRIARSCFGRSTWHS